MSQATISFPDRLFQRGLIKRIEVGKDNENGSIEYYMPVQQVCPDTGMRLYLWKKLAG